MKSICVLVLILLLISFLIYCMIYGTKAIKLVYKLGHPIRNPRKLMLKGQYKIEETTIELDEKRRLAAICVSPEKIEGTIIVDHFLGGNKEAVVSMMSHC